MPLSSYQYLIRKTQKQLIPLHCLFELTYRCNLKCVHCYIAKNKQKEIDKNSVFSILKQLKDAGCLYLTLSGGEIFLRKDFFAIAQYARRLRFALRLFTNGILIDENVAEKIKALYPLSVEISIYGFQDTHDRVTQVQGSFQKAINAIKILAARKVKVLAKILLMRQNSAEVWKLRAYLEGLGAKMRGIGGALLISPCDNADKRPLSCRLTDRQLEKYIKEESKALKLSGELPGFRKIRAGEGLCGTGRATCNITPYAELNPCVQIRLKNDNSLKERNFQDIWKNHRRINALRSLCVKDKKECLGCKFLSYCTFCPGIARLEKGSPLAKLPEFCRQARIRKEIYGSIVTRPKRVTLRKEIG